MPHEYATRFLHVARPDGAHCWAPFDDEAHLLRIITRLAPAMPPDATWSTSAKPYS